MKGKLLMGLGLGLIITSIFLTIINFYEEEKSNLSCENILSNLEISLTNKTLDQVEENGNFSKKDITRNLETSSVFTKSDKKEDSQDIFLQSDLTTEMSTIELESTLYIGILEIPSHNVRIPIINDCNDESLKLSPCRYTGSIYSNDMVLAGHNYRSHFGVLHSLERGEKIVFTDVEKKSYFYEVVDIEKIDGDDVAGMLDGDYDITLFTCTSGGIERLAVRGKRIVE